MLGTTFRNGLIQSVASSIQELSTALNETSNPLQAIRLESKLNVLQTLLTYLQSVTVTDTEDEPQTGGSDEQPTPPLATAEETPVNDDDKE